MLKRLISTLFTRGAVALLNLGILLVASRQLGSSVVGQMSLLIVNIAIVQIINEIYTGYALVHYIPRLPLKQLYRSGLLWLVVCGGLLNVVLLVFHIGLRELWLHGLILSLVITLHSFHCVILLARQKIAAYNFLMLFQPLALFVTLCLQIFALKNNSAKSYIAALYVSYCCSALISLLCYLKLDKKSKEEEHAFSISAIIRNGFVNQLGNLAHTLSNRFNYYMIAGTALVGVYSSATSLIESVWIIGGSVAPMILTHVANNTDTATNSRLTFLLSKLSFLLSVACVIILCFLPSEFFTFLLGKDFTGTKTIMLYLSPGVLCISFSTVISHYFSGLGSQRVQLIANSLGLVTTIIASYLLVPRYQLIGACYAASLSYFVAALVLVIVFMKENGFSAKALFGLKKELDLLKK